MATSPSEIAGGGMHLAPQPQYVEIRVCLQRRNDREQDW